MTETVQCKYCLMDIPSGAEKCHLCNEFQVKKAPSLFKSICTMVKDFSGLITAVSVIIGVMTVINSLTSEKVSEISAYDASSDPGQFTFLFRNDGLRAAFLGPMRIQINYKKNTGNSAAGHRTAERIYTPDTSIVKPGAEVVVSLDFILSESLQNLAEDCEIIAEIWDYNATEPRHILFKRPCIDGIVGARHSIPKNWKRTPNVVHL